MEEIFGKPLNSELELINKHTRRNFSADEVYVFSVVLCDNEIDRDFERFSVDTLKELEKMFVGVTGVFDHNPESKNQTARVFSCQTENMKNRLTSDGVPYYRLCARAYIPRSENNKNFILELDSGIKKEVSVGCSVKKRICSICGENICSCGHIKGRYYDNKLCYATLLDAVDAYEWSFVAVPAQKNAGVIKTYKNGGLKNMIDIEKRLFSGDEQTFSADEIRELAKTFRTLTQKANDGEIYRRQLMQEVEKFMSIVLPEIKNETVEEMTKSMTVEQLKELSIAFEKKAAEVIPIKPQLFRTEEKKTNDNILYKNI